MDKRVARHRHDDRRGVRHLGRRASPASSAAHSRARRALADGVLHRRRPRARAARPAHRRRRVRHVPRDGREGSTSSRGNFFALFTNTQRLLRYLAIIAVGVPIWYVIGILVTFSDASVGALGLITAAERRATAAFFRYAGCCARRPGLRPALAEASLAQARARGTSSPRRRRRWSRTSRSARAR